MKYTLTLYIIYIALTLVVFFLWERNCRLRKKLQIERRTNGYLLQYRRKHTDAIEGYKQNEIDLRKIIRFQDGVIQEFTPQHSDERPVVDFPLHFEKVDSKKHNQELGRSTIV